MSPWLVDSTRLSPAGSRTKSFRSRTGRVNRGSSGVLPGFQAVPRHWRPRFVCRLLRSDSIDAFSRTILSNPSLADMVRSLSVARSDWDTSSSGIKLITLTLTSIQMLPHLEHFGHFPALSAVTSSGERGFLFIIFIPAAPFVIKIILEPFEQSYHG
ncbi:hypothetical protein B0H19DRAFT_1368878 [Mycena capillaripes]|nr:hypothetical protein B0H19DRAFT_1368878 [Mycena capillaripes]